MFHIFISTTIKKLLLLIIVEQHIRIIQISFILSLLLNWFFLGCSVYKCHRLLLNLHLLFFLTIEKLILMHLVKIILIILLIPRLVNIIRLRIYIKILISFLIKRIVLLYFLSLRGNRILYNRIYIYNSINFGN